MRIKIIFFAILFGLSNFIFGNPIDVNSAKNIGFQFLSSQIATLNNADQLQLAGQASSMIRGENATPCYYVFNVGSSAFVIVAADDQVLPILGYSTESTFNENDVPTNVAAYLEGFRQQISHVIQNNLPATNQITQEWQALRSGSVNSTRSTSSVSALLETTWTQMGNYGSLCPADNAAIGGHVPTGCVSLAMAQIIRYWEYPIHGLGSHSYYANFASEGFGDYGLQSVNFATTTYQYNLMPAYINSSSSASEINAVATLCYHCGVSVETMYGPNASAAATLGTNWHSAEYAFINYFNYPQVYGVYRYNYTDNNWIIALKGELDQGIPVLYSGSGAIEIHAFVCDGYNESDYFHFNWGWAGVYNGYFQINALNPGSNQYNNSHSALLNISPPNTISATPSSLYFYGTPGSPSAAQNVAVTASNLSYPITASVTFPFQISNNNVTWDTSTTLDSTGGTLYVRYNPTDAGADYGSLLLTRTGAVSQHVTLFGNSCANISTFPWNEGFESDTIPSCWYEIIESGQTSWIYRNGGNTYPATTHSGSYNAYFYADSSNGNTTKLITPELNLSGLSNPQLTFWHTQPLYGSNQDNLNIYYRTTPTGSWVLLRTYNTNISTWQQEFINLPNPSSTYYLAFEGIANYGHGIALDDISIAENTTTYTITATAGEGGSINPSGANNVLSWEDLSFTITPDSLYSISDVRVDNVSIGAVSSYHFTNVVANHTIEAQFIVTPVPTISANISNLSFESSPGVPSASQNISVYGVDLSTDITVTIGSQFQVLSNGNWVSSTSLPPNGGMLNVRYNPTSTGTHNRNIILSSPGAPSVNIQLTGTSTPQIYTITASVGDNGTISPSGNVSVEGGSNKLFTITANNGYLIEDVLVDNISHGAISSYTFTNVQANHTISASFAAGINESNLQSTIYIYPNPATDYLIILNNDKSERDLLISITDLIGRILKVVPLQNDKTIVDIADLSDGIYFINIIGENSFLTKKLIKQ